MKQPGFTLIEVMISLAIVGLVLTALSGLQIALTKATVASSQRLTRLSAMTRFLYESRMKNPEQGKKITEDLKEPALKLSYLRQPVPQTSVLKDHKHLTIEHVDAQWKATRGAGIKQDRLTTFIYNPEAENETGNRPA